MQVAWLPRYPEMPLLAADELLKNKLLAVDFVDALCYLDETHFTFFPSLILVRFSRFIITFFPLTTLDVFPYWLLPVD